MSNKTWLEAQKERKSFKEAIVRTPDVMSKPEKDQPELNFFGKNVTSDSETFADYHMMLSDGVCPPDIFNAIVDGFNNISTADFSSVRKSIADNVKTTLHDYQEVVAEDTLEYDQEKTGEPQNALFTGVSDEEILQATAEYLEHVIEILRGAND